MTFFSAFIQFTHFIPRLNQSSHRAQPSCQKYPVDNVVLKGSQDIECRDNGTAALNSTPFDSTSSKQPRAIYDGGYETAKFQGVRLRIANGGAGQTGLVRAWADGFIQYMVSEGIPPFQVSPIHLYQGPNRLKVFFGH